jgi:hypothetical protein
MSWMECGLVVVGLASRLVGGVGGCATMGLAVTLASRSVGGGGGLWIWPLASGSVGGMGLGATLLVFRFSLFFLSFFFLKKGSSGSTCQTR